MMRDIEYDPDEEKSYECFQCGTVIVAESNPDRCPNCGGQMRNRMTPLE